ncbi:MAG: hypothetical protein HYY23_18190 [Verrucomicrobia bacterium]|nr:hypothetical protein [Verrucomicrobiota bacterium]
MAQPVSLAIKPANQQVTISWASGLDLVQPQKSTNLAFGVWQDFGAATTASSVTDASAAGMAFYRLRFLAPTIVTQPQSLSAALGAKATFNIVATGTAPIAYQWRRSNTNLAGQNSAALELTNVVAAVAGDYAVLISNRAGALTSAVATLTVAAAAVPPRGIYMGTFAGQTNGGFAGLVMSNRLGVILAYNPGQIQGAIITNLAVAVDGSFSNRLAQGASISGAYTPDTVSGTLVGTNASTGAFSGTIKTSSGIQQANAGYYAGTFSGLLSGDAYFILAADGTAFTYLSSPILAGGTFGKIDASNALSATVSYTIPGTTVPSLILIAGTLNSTTHQFTGTYSFSGITLGSFALARVYAP